MLDDILQKEIEKSNNSIYASEGLLENINQDVSYRLGCRLSGKNIVLDVPVLSYSKSKNKINIKLLVESKSLTDIILFNFNNIEIVSGLSKLEEKSFNEDNMSYKIKHHVDDIYKVKIKLKDKEDQNGI
tara:strand:- start:992 stop:1378 length:387 start_codon:yes stop_codon:yes gene_type:complete